jgi:ABC-type enterochelin transport system permease subunit
MAEPWGEILYRAAATVAGLVALLALLNFIYNVSESEPMIPVAGLAFSVIIFSIGLFCRYVFDVLDGGRHPTQL